MTENAKDHVRAVLDALPDDCTMDDIHYHLYVAEKVKKGLSRAEQEGVVSQKEVEQRFAKWLNK